jgi:hypothetical protein
MDGREHDAESYHLAHFFLRKTVTFFDEYSYNSEM